jgi:hypothetical protein
MERRFGYSLDELARRFDRSTSWVSRRLALVELLPEAIQQQVREGKISAQVAMKCLVPVARVDAEQCERMAAALRGMDVEIEKMVRRTPAKSMPTKDRVGVIGSITSSLNAFVVTQAMTWLAGDRAELQEQLNWKGQVYPMVMKLLPPATTRDAA